LPKVLDIKLYMLYIKAIKNEERIINTMDVVFQEAIQNKIQYHAEQGGIVKQFQNSCFTVHWSDVKCLFTKKKTQSGGWVMKTGVPTNTIGVYRIIYKPTMETMSIGVGLVSQRLSVHKQMFINQGKPTIHNGTSTKSPTASHMYKFDRHRGHWLFSWCEVPNRSLAGEYEKLLILLEQPKFNNLSMAGK